MGSLKSILSSLLTITSLSFAAHQAESSLSHRVLEGTTATAWRCIPWRSIPRRSIITCSAGWARRVMSAPLGVAVADQGTGVFASRLSRTGSGDLTGTAPREKRGMCQTWPRGPPNPRWRCGNKRGELWPRSSSLPLPIPTTAGQDTALTQVRVLWDTLRPLYF